MREFTPPYIEENLKGTSRIKPVVYCRVPAEATVIATMKRVLKIMGVHLGNPTQEALEYQLYETLRTCQTKLLVLDEFPHILRSMTDNAVRVAGDWLKNLADNFDGLILLAGEADCESVIDQRAAMGDRFPYRAYLSPFSLATDNEFNEFQKLMRAFTLETKYIMGFQDMPALSNERELYAIYALTQGNLRKISDLLFGACSRALSRGDDTLLISDFSQASRDASFRTRLTEEDVFSLSIIELKRVIFTKRNKRK